jgi:uncharacterized protein involved in outer membrane biogenesis
LPVHAVLNRDVPNLDVTPVLSRAIKWLAIVVLGLLAIVIAAGIAVAAWINSADLHGLVERTASKSLGRPVKIGSLEISLGDPIRLEVHNLRLPNAPWGSRPDMLTIESVSAFIALRPLLRGVLQYDQLQVSKLSLILERNKDGVGNWKFAGGGSAPAFGHIALIPKNRSEFPTIIDGTLANSEIDYRTGSGKLLKIAFKKILVLAPDETRPVTLSATGAYNDLPMQLRAGTASFTDLRDAGKPFSENYSLFNANTTINFRGTQMRPLDYDGVDGKLDIESHDIGRLAKALGTELPASFPASLTGDLKRDGDDWKLTGSTGKLAEDQLTGDFALKEGTRDRPDRISISAKFDRLDLDRLMGSGGKSKRSGDIWATPLDLPGPQAPVLSARIATDRLAMQDWQLADVELSADLAPGKLDIGKLQFGFAGGIANLQAKAEPQSAVTHLEASAGFAGADVARLAAMLGGQQGEIGGKADGRMAIAMTGKTLGDGLSTGRGSAVLAMTRGSVSRDILEKASTDLRTLFRKGEGRSPIDCLLAVAVLRNGMMRIEPLTLRTPEADLFGNGSVDFKRRRMDVTVKSDPHSTGLFALDIPVQIAGPFANLAAGTNAKAELMNNAALPELPDEMRALAQKSGCLKH